MIESTHQSERNVLRNFLRLRIRNQIKGIEIDIFRLTLQLQSCICIPASCQTKGHNSQIAQTSILLQARWQLSLFVLVGFLHLDLHCSEIAQVFSQLGEWSSKETIEVLTYLYRRIGIPLLRSLNRRGRILIPKFSR